MRRRGSFGRDHTRVRSCDARRHPPRRWRELLEERAALAADCYFPAVTCRLKPPRDADQSTGTGGCPAHSAVNRAAGLPRLRVGARSVIPHSLSMAYFSLPKR